ncbi:hypothetical protein P59_040 [Bacillus phage P59]|nr:hypothetical protein P59_040 [Bacillus phage P59]
MGIKSEDVIVCPYCDFEDKDWHEYVDPTEMTAEFPLNCSKCNEAILVIMETTVTFKTEPLEGEVYDEEVY